MMDTVGTKRRMSLMIAVGLLVSACSTAPEPMPEPIVQGGEGEVEETAAPEEEAEAKESAQTEVEAPLEEESERSAPEEPLFGIDGRVEAEGITYLGFGEQNRILIGYGDSQLAILEEDLGGELRQIFGEPYRVLTVNQAGTMALLESEPGLMVRVSDQETILRMNDLGKVFDGSFSVDGSIFLAAVEGGRIHIWHRGSELLNLPDETIQRFLDRQMPDFTTQLTPSEQRLRLTHNREVLRGDMEGRVSFWSPTKPTEIRHMANFQSSPTQVSVGSRFGVAATGAGEMGVFRYPQGGFYRWSLGAEAKQVFAHPELGEGLIAHQGDHLRRLALEDGSVEWEVRLPEGEPCGMGGDEAGERLLVCLDGHVAVLSAAEGTLEAVIYRQGAELVIEVK